MGVRFDAGARRAIVAATIEAEKRGRSKPVPSDLLLGLMSLPESPVPAAVAGLGADARARIAAAMGRADEGGIGGRDESADDAERILRQAAAIAAARGGEAEVSILDILAAALVGGRGSPSAATDGKGAPIGGEPGASRRAAADEQRGARSDPVGMSRAGIGYDSHRFGEQGPLILGGVTIPECVRLIGHSDGDAIAHAITDAILGAACAGDIGEMFSDTDPANRGRDSLDMLRAAVRRVGALGFVVHQVDATVVAERPRIAAYREAMRSALAAALGITPDRVSVKGKTNEGMGWVGRGEGIACVAVATLATTATA